MRSSTIVWKAIRYHARLAFASGSAFALLGICAALLSLVYGSSQAQFELSAISANAGHPLKEVLLVDDDPTLSALIREANPVWVTHGSAETTEALVHTSSHLYTDPELRFGQLIDGRYPISNRETTISRELQRHLEVFIGEYLSFDEKELLVVGTHVLGTAPDDLSLYFLDTAPLSEPPTYFLTEDSVIDQNPTLAQARIDRIIQGRYSSTEALIQQDSFNEEFGLALSVFSFGIGVFAVLTGLVTALTFRRQTSKSAALLQNLGMSNMQVRLSLSTIPYLTATIGLGAAIVVVALLASPAARLLDGRFSQFWLKPQFSSPPIFIAIGLSFLAIAVVHSRLALVFESNPSRTRLIRSSVGLGPLLSSLVGLGAAIYFLDGTLERLTIALTSSIACISAVTYLLSAGWLSSEKAKSSQVLRSWFLNRFFLITLLVTSICCLATVGATTLRGEVGLEKTNSFSLFESLPPGSLQIETLGSAAAETLLDEFVRFGGTGRAIALADNTSGVHYRVASPGALQCFEEKGQYFEALFPCLSNGKQVPVHRVGLAPQGSATSAASVRFFENDNDKVILLAADKESGEVLWVEELKVSPDEFLGSETVGLIVDPSLLANKLEPVGISTLGLESFSSLDEPDQAVIRQQVKTLAPAAVINEDPGFDDRGRIVLAAMLSVLASALSVCLILTWGAVLVESSHEITRSLRQLRPNEQFITRFFAVCLSPLAIAAFVGVTIGALVGSRGLPGSISYFSLVSALPPAPFVFSIWRTLCSHSLLTFNNE